MELTRRTLLRHALVAAALMALIPAALSAGNLPRGLVWIWLANHYAFLMGLALALALLGVGADLLVQHRCLLQLLLLPHRQRARRYREHLSGRGPRGQSWLLAWAGCPRCVGYWAGGLAAGSAAAFYWGNAIGAVYFALLGAAISATLATGAHLVRLTLRRLAAGRVD